MSANQIILVDIFRSESIVTRAAAGTLLDIISKTPDSKIFLDFAGIKFASRSFFDELYSYKSKFKLLGKSVEFVNLDSPLLQLYHVVERTNSTRNHPFYSSVANAQIINI